MSRVAEPGGPDRGPSTSSDVRAQLAITGRPLQALTADRLAEFVADELGIHRLDCSYANIGPLGVEPFAEIVKRHGVRVDVVSVSPNMGRIGSPAASQLARVSLLQAIGDAVRLGAPAVQFHTDVPPGNDQRARLQAVADELEPVLEAATEADITLLVENNFDSRQEDLGRVNPARYPDVLVAMLDVVGSANLKLTFDACNFVLTGVDPLAAWRTLEPWVYAIHLKDCRPLHPGDDVAAVTTVTDSSEGIHVPTPLGAGVVPWTALFERIRSGAFAGPLVLEPMAADGDVMHWSCEAVKWVYQRAEQGPDTVSDTPSVP